jgi:hypothetical protein
MRSDDRDLDLLARVGAKLGAVGLTGHRDHARKLYADLAAERPPREGGWTMAFVVEWARILRIRPHEKDYPVRMRAEGCGCPVQRHYTEMTFPGGAKLRCGACDLVWLMIG